MSKPVYELMGGTGYCRSCDTKLKRNVDYAVKLYSFRNTGQHIILCKKCVELMAALIEKE